MKTTNKAKRAKWLASITVALSAMFVLSGGVTANAAVVGFCEVKPNYAHGSTHVNGTINATGTAECTIKMAEIYLKTTLVRSDGVLFKGTPRDKFNLSYLSSNAATACANGGKSFKTRVEYVLVAPSGYTPIRVTGSVESGWIGPVCANPGSRISQEQLNALSEAAAGEAAAGITIPIVAE